MPTTAPSTLEALLARVLAEPHADAPRLDYAAELRRLEREAEATAIERQVADARRYVELGVGAPERATIRHAGPQPFPSHKTPHPSDWGTSQRLGGAWEVTVRRGFVESAVVEAVTADDLARAGALHPLESLSIRGPSFQQPARAPRALLGAPWLARLRHLALHEFTREEDVAGAVSGASLPALERLTLRDCDLDDRAAKTLATSDLPVVDHLSLAGNAFGAAGLTALLDRFGASLRTLQIEGHTAITDAFVRALTRASVPKLRTLTLGARARTWSLSAGALTALREASALADVRIALLGASADDRNALDARFPAAALTDSDVRTDDGLLVSCSITNGWHIERELLPPILLSAAGFDLRTVVGATFFVLDGALRNDFDPFTLGPGETRRVGLRVPAEGARRLPAGPVRFVLGGGSILIELPRP